MNYPTDLFPFFFFNSTSFIEIRTFVIKEKIHINKSTPLETYIRVISGEMK